MHLSPIFLLAKCYQFASFILLVFEIKKLLNGIEIEDFTKHLMKAKFLNNFKLDRLLKVRNFIEPWYLLSA